MEFGSRDVAKAAIRMSLTPTREAVSQITNKAIGLNAGGKIGIARSGEHVAVCVFFGIGLLHLNEVSIGPGHRAI